MKTLAKIEIRAVWVMLIYFIALVFFTLTDIISSVQQFISINLYSGISEVMTYSNFTTPTALFNGNINGFVYLMCFGIIILVYLSFKNDSNHETGRFLKTLPFTSQQRYFTKIGVSLSIITIAHIVYTILILLVRHYYLSELKPLYEITLLNQEYAKLLPISVLIQFLICAYLFNVAFYTFLVLCEYLISSNMASLIIGVLVGIAPIFITESLESIFRSNIFCHSLRRFISDYYATLIPELPTLNYTVFSAESSTTIYGFGYIRILESFGTQCIAYLAIIVIGMFLNTWFCQKQALEKDDILIPMKWMRGVFIVGVTVCSALLFADIYLLFNPRFTLELLWLAIGGIIGFVVAWLIAHKGMKTLRGI